jgi:HK97 family phage prohead protease
MTPPKAIDDLRASLRKLAWPREHRERGKVELRAKGDGRTLEMFIPFASESVDLGFRELIDPGAFTRSIRAGRSSPRNDIFALWSHDSSQPLARQANSTLDFEERADGLTAIATLQPEIDYHQRALQAVGAGLVRGTSFGFETVRDAWEYNDDGEATRTLLECKLHEVSPVVFPAYQESDAEARGALAQASRAIGVDAAELVAILKDVKDGKAPSERRDGLQGWISRLTELLPSVSPVTPAPTADDYLERKIRTRERLLVGKA